MRILQLKSNPRNQGVIGLNPARDTTSFRKASISQLSISQPSVGQVNKRGVDSSSNK